jgi:hypothetical protein
VRIGTARNSQAVTQIGLGATLLGLGYELFTGWIASRRAAATSPGPTEAAIATVDATANSNYAFI